MNIYFQKFPLTIFKQVDTIEQVHHIHDFFKNYRSIAENAHIRQFCPEYAFISDVNWYWQIIITQYKIS